MSAVNKGWSEGGTKRVSSTFSYHVYLGSDTSEDGRPPPDVVRELVGCRGGCRENLLVSAIYACHEVIAGVLDLSICCNRELVWLPILNNMEW